jgi:peroxiredoxin
VHFFATWCEPCREELPALRRLVQRTDPNEFSALAISVAEPDSRVRTFIENLPVNFPVLLDRDRSVAKSWGVYALPTTFILDRELKPRLFVETDYDWDKFDITSAQENRSLRTMPGSPSNAQGATQ